MKKAPKTSLSVDSIAKELKTISSLYGEVVLTGKRYYDDSMKVSLEVPKKLSIIGETKTIFTRRLRKLINEVKINNCKLIYCPETMTFKGVHTGKRLFKNKALLDKDITIKFPRTIFFKNIIFLLDPHDTDFINIKNKEGGFDELEYPCIVVEIEKVTDGPVINLDSVSSKIFSELNKSIKSEFKKIYVNEEMIYDRDYYAQLEPNRDYEHLFSINEDDDYYSEISFSKFKDDGKCYSLTLPKDFLLGTFVKDVIDEPIELSLKDLIGDYEKE